MTDQFHPTSIAGRLTRGQQSVISGLDRNPAPIGCGEEIALRLSVATKRRPALTAFSRDPETGWRYFTLNDFGMAVKEVL